MFRNFHEDLKSIWLFVDVSEGLVVVFVGFVLVLGEFLHPSVPFSLDVVEGSVDVSFDLPLFTGKMFFLSFSFVFGDFPAGRRGCGGGCEGGGGFLCFESSLVWDSDGEWWWRRRFLFNGGSGSTVGSE